MQYSFRSWLAHQACSRISDASTVWLQGMSPGCSSTHNRLALDREARNRTGRRWRCATAAVSSSRDASIGRCAARRSDDVIDYKARDPVVLRRALPDAAKNSAAVLWLTAAGPPDELSTCASIAPATAAVASNPLRR
jgi:hypothetical protein